MTQLNAVYLGDGQTELIHGPSGAKIRTDLPPTTAAKGVCFPPLIYWQAH